MAYPADVPRQPDRLILVVCFAVTFFPGVRFLAFIQFRDLSAFERQVVHQSFRAEYEPDNWVANIVRIDRLASAQIDQCYRSVDTNLPAFAVAEFLERFFGHKCDDDGLGLRAQLQSE